MVKDTHRIRFRPLAESDLPLMLEWLNRPHMQRWWRDRVLDLDDVREKYLPRIQSADMHRPFLALMDDEPVGYIQVYDCAQGDSDWWPDEPGPGVVGIDQFLGDGDRLGQGLGTAMVGAFCRELFAGSVIAWDVTEIRTDPHPDNPRAIRCYEKVGFQRRGEIVTPDGPAVWMVLTREALARLLEEQRYQGVTERLDAVYSAEPDTAEQDALVADLQRRVLDEEDW